MGAHHQADGIAPHAYQQSVSALTLLVFCYLEDGWQKNAYLGCCLMNCHFGNCSHLLTEVCLDYLFLFPTLNCHHAHAHAHVHAHAHAHVGVLKIRGSLLLFSLPVCVDGVVEEDLAAFAFHHRYTMMSSEQRKKSVTR